MLQNKIQAVVFDMDGTIFATEALYFAAWQHAMEVLGLSMPSHVYNSLVGLHFDDCRVILKEYIPCAQTMDRLCDLSDIHFVKAISSGDIPLKEGIHDLLDYLEERGLPCAVATNTEKSRAQLKLKSSGLFDRFKAVIGGNCVTHPKPAPDIFLRAAEALGISPEACLALEDSPVGVTAAYQAGMTVFMIPDMVPASDEARAQATAVYPSLFDVIAWLKEKKGL